MNRLKKMLYGACALLATSFASAPVQAENNFSGLYMAVQSAANGVELDGSTTDSNSQVANGKGGMFGMTAGVDVGYSMAMGDAMFFGLGVQINPGDASMDVDSGGSANTNNTDVTLELGDLLTYYATAGYTISENSALYIKYGSVEADLSVTGDVTKLTSLDGETWALGTVSQHDSGLYFQTEAGITEYDNLTLTGLGTYIATTNSATIERAAIAQNKPDIPKLTVIIGPISSDNIKAIPICIPTNALALDLCSLRT